MKNLSGSPSIGGLCKTNSAIDKPRTVILEHNTNPAILRSTRAHEQKVAKTVYVPKVTHIEEEVDNEEDRCKKDRTGVSDRVGTHLGTTISFDPNDSVHRTLTLIEDGRVNAHSIANSHGNYNEVLSVSKDLTVYIP